MNDLRTLFFKLFLGMGISFRPFSKGIASGPNDLFDELVILMCFDMCELSITF